MFYALKPKKVLACLLAAIMLFLITVVTISVLTETTASARVTQAQINRLREEKREYERKKTEIQSRINAIEFERMTEMSKKEVLDQRITLTGLEIKNLSETIDQYYMLIREKEYEVYLAQNREENQLNKYRNRVRDMEENGIFSYLEIIFGSTSFSDMLARIDFVSDIMRADEKLYTDLQNAKTETEAVKADLEETKAELDEEKEQLEYKEVELLEQLEEAHELIRTLEANIETENELYQQTVSEEDRVQREINTAVELLRRQQEAERIRRIREQQNQAQSSSAAATGPAGGTDAAEAAPGDGNSNGGGGGGSVSSTGQLSWPVNGAFWSPFGMRNGRMHQGIDIGAPHGTPILAADSGTVITSRYGGAYGNYVVISHGNGITTLYSHNSSNAVKVGDYVSRGQVVGYVGSTGNATGNHIHFEVSVNGTRVDPMTML